MSTDYQSLYFQLGRLLESAPDMSTHPAVQTAEVLRWLGRGQALVDMVGRGIDAISFTQAADRLRYANWVTGRAEIFAILYRALAHCELRAPSPVAGTFIPVGSPFDAFAAISKLLQPAQRDVMILDPYLDEAVLTDFGLAVPEGVTLRLLADEATHKATLLPAARRWTAQYGATRPLAVRLAPPKSLHDRALFVDGTTAWTLTQSIKDFAKRSPAEIIRADATAALKIDAYETVWAASRVIV